MARPTEDVRLARAVGAERRSSWCGAVAAFVPALRVASQQLHNYGCDQPERPGHQSACGRQHHDCHDFARRVDKCCDDTNQPTDKRGARVLHDSNRSGCLGAEHGGQSAGSGLVWDVDGPDFADGKSRNVENDTLCSSYSLVCYRVWFNHGDGTFYGAIFFQVVFNSADLVAGLVAAFECTGEHDPGAKQRYRLYRMVAKETLFIISRTGF